MGWRDDPVAAPPAASGGGWQSDPVVGAPASPVAQGRSRLATSSLGRMLATAAGNAGLTMVGPVGSAISGLLSPDTKGRIAETAAESVAPAVSGMVAGPAAGYAGIAGSVLPGPQGQGANWAQATQQALTYAPRTASGQAGASALAIPGNTLDKYAGQAGGAIAEATGSPALGAATKTAIDVGVPSLVGRGVMKIADKVFPEPQAPAPTVAELKARADASYAAARSSPEIAPQSGLQPVISDVERALTDNGYDPQLHPATSRALNKLYEEATRPDVQGHNATGLEAVRRVLTNAENNAYNARNWDDYRIANLVTDRFDKMLSEAAPSASADLNEARSTFSTMRKTQTIEQIINRAENAANGQNQAGYENALRIQFKQLADSKRFAQFTPDEQAAILQTARGSGWFQNTARNVGRGAVRGPITAGFTALLAASHGSPLALAGILLTEVARHSATAMRQGDAMAVRDLVASGGQAVQPQAVPIPPEIAAAPALLAPVNADRNQENQLVPRRNALARRP